MKNFELSLQSLQDTIKQEAAQAEEREISPESQVNNKG